MSAPASDPSHSGITIRWDEEELATKVYAGPEDLTDELEALDLEVLVEEEHKPSSEVTTPLDLMHVRALLATFDDPTRRTVFSRSAAPSHTLPMMGPWPTDASHDEPVPSAAAARPTGVVTQAIVSVASAPYARPLPEARSDGPADSDLASGAASAEREAHSPSSLVPANRVVASASDAFSNARPAPVQRFVPTQRIEIAPARTWRSAALPSFVVAFALFTYAGARWLEYNKPGVITLVTTPGDSTVLVDGQAQGSVSPFVKTGTSPHVLHTLEVRKSGYRSWKQEVELEAGQDLKLTVALEPERSLPASSPASADVARAGTIAPGSSAAAEGLGQTDGNKGEEVQSVSGASDRGLHAPQEPALQVAPARPSATLGERENLAAGASPAEEALPAEPKQLEQAEDPASAAAPVEPY